MVSLRVEQVLVLRLQKYSFQELDLIVDAILRALISEKNKPKKVLTIIEITKDGIIRPSDNESKISEIIKRVNDQINLHVSRKSR
jgi:hypothetical protein